jgi:hypothetical protein
VDSTRIQDEAATEVFSVQEAGSFTFSGSVGAPSATGTRVFVTLETTGEPVHLVATFQVQITAGTPASTNPIVCSIDRWNNSNGIFQERSQFVNAHSGLASLSIVTEIGPTTAGAGLQDYGLRVFAPAGDANPITVTLRNVNFLAMWVKK